MKTKSWFAVATILMAFGAGGAQAHEDEPLTTQQLASLQRGFTSFSWSESGTGYAIPVAAGALLIAFGSAVIQRGRLRDAERAAQDYYRT